MEQIMSLKYLDSLKEVHDLSKAQQRERTSNIW